MRLSTSLVAIISLPAVWSLPTSQANKLPTCGANQCLADDSFDGCAPGDLVCLCKLSQPEVSRYVETVQPCLDGEPGKQACTLGAVANYKQLLVDVCSKPEYGSLNKTVEWAPVTYPPQ